MPKNIIQEKTFEFSLNVIHLLDKFPRTYKYDVLGKQILRSGTSIGANVREAQGNSTYKHFIQYYSVALRSANETLYWLELIRSVYSNQNEVNELIEELKNISNILVASIKTMKAKVK